MNRFRDIGNIFLQCLPVSRFFRLRRVVLRLMGVEVGTGASVNGHTWFYGRGKVRIGVNTWIGPGCRFYATAGTIIDIGANCDVAPEVSFVTGTHVPGTEERRAGPGYSESIGVGNGCWIGVRVTVLGGIHIGNGCVIAAGSLIRSDIPDNSLAAGTPAEVKKELKG